MDPRATAGRIVHYYADGEVTEPGDCHAAIVNHDSGLDGITQLTVFGLAGPVVIPHVQYSEDPQVGCWSWMPYQKQKAGNQSESAEPRPDDVPDSFNAMDYYMALSDRLSVLEKEPELASRVEKLEKHNEDRAVPCDDAEQAE